jgi:feruloyl-CoA synthase
VKQAFDAITPDDHAKYLLTSGSTGHPKVAINTHRMLCANQQMIAQAWRFLEHEKPVIVDWLPWSHTFGGNHNLNLVLCNGGTLYIDEGRPVPGLIEKSVRNLREVQPNAVLQRAPRLRHADAFLEQDESFARDFFGRLRSVLRRGRLAAVQLGAAREAVPEGARRAGVVHHLLGLHRRPRPAITSAHWRSTRAGCIGLPLPGTWS